MKIVLNIHIYFYHYLSSICLSVIYLYIYVCVCICTHKYIFIYMHVYIYIHMYIYIYLHTYREIDIVMDIVWFVSVSVYSYLARLGFVILHDVIYITTCHVIRKIKLCDWRQIFICLLLAFLHWEAYICIYI